MTDIQFINLTPHIINLQKFDGTTLELPPSGTVARVEEARATARMIGDMGVSLASYGEVVNLPAPKPWTCYIVSSLVLAAVPERPDVFAPGPAIRNEAGQVIGANGLSCTPSYARLNPVDEPAHPAPSYAEAARAIVEEESDDDPAETLHFADDPQPTAATPANHGFTPYQLSQLTDCGLMAWDGNRYFKAYHFGVLDGGPVQFVITAGYDGMPADWRGEYDSLDDLLKSMTETAPADQWSDEDDDDDETPVYGYFAACTYGGNSWELYKTPEQQLGVTGDYMRDLRAKVASIELPENIEWVEVSPIEQGVLIIVGSQFNSLYSPYNDEPMFLKYEPSIVTSEQFETTYPTLAAAARLAAAWEQNEMVKFDHSWRPNIN